MISDIDKDVKSAKVSSFADDTRALNAISSQADVANLQSDLETLYEWSEFNNAMFNPEKFECMRYGLNKDIIDNSFYLSNTGTVIQCKSSVKDLGVTFTSDAKFNEHISNTVISAGLKCGWILRTFKTRESFPLLVLWKALVMPILDYCSQLWSPIAVGQIKALEMWQLNYL